MVYYRNRKPPQSVLDGRSDESHFSFTDLFKHDERVGVESSAPANPVRDVVRFVLSHMRLDRFQHWTRQNESIVSGREGN